jgi:hypothetical protein
MDDVWQNPEALGKSPIRAAGIGSATIAKREVEKTSFLAKERIAGSRKPPSGFPKGGLRDSDLTRSD